MLPSKTHADGTRDGDITVRSDADILKTGGAESTLRFEAHDDVVIDGTIGASGSAVLNVELIADYDASGGDSDVVINNSVSTNGGDFTATAPDDFEITAAGSVDVTGSGGNISIDQGGVFSSVNANTLITADTGTITVNQNAGGSIQNVIDAISNSGTGTNTVNVSDGTYAENVTVDKDNITLNGEQAGNTAYQRTAADESTLEGFVNVCGGHIQLHVGRL